MARGYELRITLVDPKDPRKEGTRHRFDNLKGAVSPSIELLSAGRSVMSVQWELICRVNAVA